MGTRRCVMLAGMLLAVGTMSRGQGLPGAGPWARGKPEAGSVLGQASVAAAGAKTPQGFQALKALAGEWDGRSQGGTPVHVSYKLTFGGSALVETLTPTGEPEMTTVYSADGTQVAVTHFCSANNQPRMRTTALSKSKKKFVFTYVGATNLASPAAGHMQALVVTIEDNNHFTQQWTWRANGKDVTEIFRYEREK
jgi:hypothetical protein